MLEYAFIPHVDFATELRAEIDRQGISVKELSRRVAEILEIGPESARPLIYKYLRGEHDPEQPMRVALALSLGLGPDFFRAPGAGVERVAMRLRRLVDELERELVA